MCCVCFDSVIYGSLLDRLILSVSLVSFECFERFINAMFSDRCIISSISGMPC